MGDPGSLGAADLVAALDEGVLPSTRALGSWADDVARRARRREPWTFLVTSVVGLTGVGAVLFVPDRLVGTSITPADLDPLALLVVLGLLGGAVYELGRQSRSRDWSRARARIRFGTAADFGGEGCSHVPVVLYVYRVGGQVHLGHRVHLTGLKSSFQHAWRRALEYEIGGVVDCFYDPADPAQAVLDKRVNYTLAGMLVAMAALSSGAWFVFRVTG